MVGVPLHSSFISGERSKLSVQPPQSSSEFLCQACHAPTVETDVAVTIWLGAELKVVEGVPAHVCTRCQARYYDSAVDEKLTSLIAAGLPDRKASRVMSVAVFDYGKITEFASGEEKVPLNPAGSSPGAAAPSSRPGLNDTVPDEDTIIY